MAVRAEMPAFDEQQVADLETGDRRLLALVARQLDQGVADVLDEVPGPERRVCVLAALRPVIVRRGAEQPLAERPAVHLLAVTDERVVRVGDDLARLLFFDRLEPPVQLYR